MTGAYERLSQRLLAGQPMPKPLCWFNGLYLVRGTHSLHRTKQSRTWRLFWRLKDVRK